MGEGQESFHRGWVHFYKATKEENTRARVLFERATQLDPQFAEPWAALARTHQWDLLFGWTDAPDRSTAESLRAAQRCVALDDRFPLCHISLGVAGSVMGETEKAVQSLELAVRLNPSSPAALTNLGWQLALAGRASEGISHLERGIRLSPRDPESWILFAMMGMAQFAAGSYEEALDWARRSAQLRPDWAFAHLVLAASYGQLGQADEARAALADVRRLRPAFSLADQPQAIDPGVAERLREGLRRAGVEG